MAETTTKRTARRTTAQPALVALDFETFVRGAMATGKPLKTTKKTDKRKAGK